MLTFASVFGIIAKRSEGGAANRTGFKKKFEEIRKKFLTNALVSGIPNKLSARAATIKAFDKKLKTLKKVLDNVKCLW